MEKRIASPAVPFTELRDTLARLVPVWANALLAERGLSVRTVEAYRQDMELFLLYLDEWSMGRAAPRTFQLGEQDIMLFLAWLRARQNTGRSLARRLSALRSFFAFAVEEKVLPANPAALLESALTIPLPLTRLLVGPACAVSYPLIRKHWFAKAQFDALHLPQDLFEEYYRDSCRISQDSLAALLRANAGFSLPAQLASCNARVLVTAGSRERPVMRRSARLLAERLPHARLEILAGFRHGEFSVWHAAEYAEAVEGLLSGQP